VLVRQTATNTTARVFWSLMDNDDALAARLARNLDAAFPDLVASHADRLYTIALRLLGNAADAEEVAQDTLVRAHRAMAGYQPARIAELRLRPWLAAIAVNLSRNRRRRMSDRNPAESLEPLAAAGFDPRDDGTADPPTVIAGREAADELADVLLQLPAPLRSAVVLRHVDGLSIAEIAEALGRPEGTIKAHVSRGLDRLRSLLEVRNAAAIAQTDPPLSPTRSNVMAGRELAAAEVLR
jgi:RNA polymerase sigma factor (sigma-70 family)